MVSWEALLFMWQGPRHFHELIPYLQDA